MERGGKKVSGSEMEWKYEIFTARNINFEAK